MWKLSGRLGNQMFQFAYLYNQVKLGSIPDFYLQDPYYFAESIEELKVLFSQGIEPINQVAIHVRRGDYANNPFYVDLMETTYYENAMALFPKEKFLVFSDDIEWCKQQEIFKDCDFSEGNDEITDFNLMAGCKAVICANSSYSLWAGLLCKGKVTAPKAWYADGIERTVCPDNFIQI
jgi:hypothetical protein